MQEIIAIRGIRKIEIENDNPYKSPLPLREGGNLSGY
jgi:hypothetical protein